MNRLLTSRAVSRDVWVEQNHDYLWSIYRMIQEMNDASGRRVFDRDRCTFTRWCDVAYAHSTLYAKQDRWMYDDEGEEVDECYHGTES